MVTKISRSVVVPLCFVFLSLVLVSSTESLSNEKPSASILRRRSRSSHGMMIRRNPIYRRGLTEGGGEDHDHDHGDFKIFYYNQTLDHFSYRPESYTTFKQRYVINSKYWGGSNNTSPILVCFGGEDPFAPLELEGLIPKNAPHFHALLVYIEHRYYGESVPFGSKEIAYANASTLGYLNMGQALADYAELIWYIKKKFSARYCPVIVTGGSYAGELAAYFRLKYPHLAIGAWASSAPILDYNDINEYDEYDTIVTKDFKEVSESCYNTIKQSWDVIDTVGSSYEGLQNLSKTFNTCSPLKNLGELKGFLGYTYALAAQYDAPPEYPVNVICNVMDEMPIGTDPLTRISAGVNAYLGSPCINITEYDPDSSSNYIDPFTFQECTELYGPTKTNTTNVDTIFQVYPSDQNTDEKEGTTDCWGVQQRPHWAVIEFGGQDLKLVLQKFGSNILFTNGLRDPYSIQGVLENISDSIMALTMRNGSHCLDMMDPIMPDDPDWLVSHKKQIIKVIKNWIDQYQIDLEASLDPKSKSGANQQVKEFTFISLVSVFIYIFLLSF